MRILRNLGVLVVLLAVAAAVVIVAPVVKGQSGRDTVRPRLMAELDWPRGDVHIGAAVRDVDSADIAREQLAADAGGAVIEEVDSDGPAATAGLKTGDVVVEYDGEKVRSARHLIRLIRESRGDRAVKMVVLRGGRRTDLTITPREGRVRTFTFDGPALRGSLRDLRDLGDDFGRLGRDLGRDFSFEFDGFPRSSVRGRLGVTVQELTPQLAEYFGVKDGVLISSVTADSPATKAGLKAGDVITNVNDRSILNARDLIRELQEVDDGKEVSIAVMRDRKAITVKATLEDRRPRRTRITRRGV